jgi:hypothetical protein
MKVEISTTELVDQVREFLQPHNPRLRALVLIVVNDGDEANSVNFDLSATAKPGTPKEVLETLIRYLASMPDLREKIEAYANPKASA